MEILFTRSDETINDLGDIAESIGVDKKAFEKCVADKTFSKKVEDQIVEAAKAGARGTPYTIIITQEGTLIPLNGALPYPQVEETVKTLLLGSAE